MGFFGLLLDLGWNLFKWGLILLIILTVCTFIGTSIIDLFS